MTKKKNNNQKENKAEKFLPKKIKLLITIVDRSKVIYYVDLLEQFEINMQSVILGTGTADSDMVHYLGLDGQEKGVILSFIREEKVKQVMTILAEKFEKIKNGKGIAYTIPIKSLIGVSIYSFLSNQPTKKEEK